MLITPTRFEQPKTCRPVKTYRCRACCSKKTGYCNYGPEACGTNGQSPNDKCWSNCDAHAECGEFAKTPGKECPLKDFKDIPVGALTHLYFSFGYITPGDFNVAPMDNAPSSLFSDLTDMKKKNSGLKAFIALGGWTFNDNGTATQPVYSNMVSNAGNRARFISNLFSFMREYAFDGVDFDWEYPGAPDRGGHEDDGKNFVTFLKELKDAIARQPTKYEVSFTVPTSYWYLRWFDLKAVDHVDFVNVMSYDLHGIWDSTNPIGSHVLAHTNLTEIKLALDLFWRNDVPANKLNLGLGFYGRSFQLSDPSCYKPGCNFKGGANPGACTKNSGTLSYKEITQVIDQNKIKPYYDKENAVKYIVWNQDQWVSYDDEDTFKQKIDFGNKLGLGGLLIWSIDQDTEDLKALQAVLAPKGLKQFQKDAENKDYWKDSTAEDCYVSDCGQTCRVGFAPVTHQPCGGAKAVTRHSKEKDSNLCCPLDSTPDADKCTWRGKAPSCNGRCHDGEVLLELNRWGDGKYCEDGNKAYCCEVTNDKENKCYWSGVGKNCNKGDTALTFAGTFLETVVDILGLFPPTLIGVSLERALDGLDMDLERRFCCPPEDAKKWTNCQWYGEPGSCFDNHCPAGHSVQLATSAYGLGESCAPRLERDRVFCCDPSKGRKPFLPVPLDRLFPHPPEGDDVDTDFDLNVDNTWGDGHAGKYLAMNVYFSTLIESTDTADDEPNESSFGFVVITSPEELQVSLDKRDGSHWELFNCNDAISEEEQTIQMFCIDTSETSNCHKISLGHGVPGTILEMPKGCGPSRYAVAKSMVLSEKPLPEHLSKRHYDAKPVVYDLTFDFDWHRVPRDLGDTQLRVDYSNEVGYWDNIVNKAAKHKRRRSLEEVGGNHRVAVVADGWLRMNAAADLASSGNCPFTYGIDVGADLFATVEAPSPFKWAPRKFPISSVPAKAMKKGGTCPTKQKRDVYDALLGLPLLPRDDANATTHALAKRAPVVGPLLTLPKSCFFCPSPSASSPDCANIRGYEPSEVNDPDRVSKRGLSNSVHYSHFEKRASKNLNFCKGSGECQIRSPPFDSSGIAVNRNPGMRTYAYTNLNDCNDFGFSTIATPGASQSRRYATEHILEFQLLPLFLEDLKDCQWVKKYWTPEENEFTYGNDNKPRSPLQHVAYQFPGTDNNFNNEFVLLDSDVNRAKAGMWGQKSINSQETMTNYINTMPDRAIKNLKDVLSALKYHQIDTISTTLVNQAHRVGEMFNNMEIEIGKRDPSFQPKGLQAVWSKWIKGRAERARTRAETYLEGNLENIKTGYSSDYQKDKVLLEKINKLEAAIKGRTTWNNPFP
ncbi:MAG: hypothetical protein Q9219_007102 [cf. Caloplaca sp. 3 TL-2023]